MQKIITYVLLLFFAVSMAQTENTIIPEIESLFYDIPEQDFRFYSDSIQPDHLKEAFLIELSSTTNYRDSVIDQQIRHSGRDLGLDFKANGRYTGDNILSFDQEDEYNNRFSIRAGLQWNVLRDGWVNNKKEKDYLTLEKEINTIKTQNGNANYHYGLRYQNLIYLFNKLLIKEFDDYLSFLNKQLEIYNKLYYNRDITYLEVLKTKKQIASVETRLSQIKNFNDHYAYKADTLEAFSLFGINIQNVISHYHANTSTDKLVALKKEQLQLKGSQLNLPRFNINAQYQATSSGVDGVNFSPTVGFNLSVPLRSKTNKTLVDLEGKLIEETLGLQQENIVKELNVHHMEFNYKLKQFKDLYYAFQEIKELQLTASFIKQEAKVETYITSFKHINALKEIKIESIDLLCGMYLKALKIFGLAGIENKQTISEFVRAQKFDAPNRHVYIIWEVNQPKEDVNFIINFLKRKQLKNVILKGGYDMDELSGSLKRDGFNVMLEEPEFPTISIESDSNPNEFYKNLGQNTKPVTIDNLHKLLKLEQQQLL